MKYVKLACVFVAIMSLQSCGMMKINRLMKTHNEVLSNAAYSKTMSPEQKLDALGGTFVQVIEESLGFVNPKFSVKHFDQFAKQNKREIDAIMSSVEAWQGEMGEVEQILLIAKFATKSYAKDLTQLLPKLERKINRSVKTIGFLSKFVNILTPKF